MTKPLSIAGAAIVAALAVCASQAQAHASGYEAQAGYADEGSDCGRDQFTILGGHAGATVLGFNAGVGGHFGFGDGCGHHHHHARAVPVQGYAEPPQAPPQVAPPQVDPYPAAYPQAPWGAPYAYRTYGRPRTYAPPPPPAYGPPPPPYDPCDVCARPAGW